MTMRLRELLAGIVDVPTTHDCDIRGLEIDSRHVRPGALFCALPGVQVDGRTFIAQAQANGAAAVLCEANGWQAAAQSVPVLSVPGLRSKLGAIADRFYGSPSRTLVVIGVTGTNGKTTCTQLLTQALDTAARRAAVVGTLGYGYPDALNNSLHTTPDAVTLQRLFAEFRAAGTRYVSVEVSSHALDQGRVNAVSFDVAVFTNLTHDHLDYHGSMRTYGDAKARLFDTPGLRHAIINVDDEFGRELRARIKGRMSVSTYGLTHGDIRAETLELTHEGLRLRVATPGGRVEFDSQLYGRFNAANLLAVLAVLLALDFDLHDAAARLRLARPAPGRLERFGQRPGAPLVVVDYAHTPDALEQVLLALREHGPRRLWCVFGCGGNRDRAKRPVMGRIAEQLADIVILTDDNPRNESPDSIIAEIRAGMRAAPRIMRDRKTAIAMAIAEAAAEDIVLVAGKGHEDYQQIGETRIPYSDRQVVRELLGEAA
ncbi:MAG: UDP-N-acetylmuramoyl-L-alanyl-D-glutamate--2,6-diaminopimelate ligase [Pseudomonadota bacterium]|nr:MAG: UDP-N-acetylmuramoyl-L-alanyl-D-glutamate--2,6-diaminopimelate ligase [Pseudomonadota bacterium]